MYFFRLLTQRDGNGTFTAKSFVRFGVYNDYFRAGGFIFWLILRGWTLFAAA